MPDDPRRYTGLAQGVDRRKKLTAMLSATLLACVPWMQISKAATDQVIVQPSALLAAVAAGVAIHLAFLAFNSVAVSALRLGGKHASPGEKLFSAGRFTLEICQ